MEIVVVGATGYVGKNVVSFLAARGHTVTAVSRLGVHIEGATHVVAQADVLDPVTTDVAGDAVIYLSAIAHRGKSDTDDKYDIVNHQGAINWAEHAARSGVRRFVYLSSSKVHGSSTAGIINEDSPLIATDPYSRSKISAEQSLEELRKQLDVVILRPPLVIGPGAKGNVNLLRRLSARALPLPVLRSGPVRSVISIGNLLTAIEIATTVDAGPENSYLIANNPPISTGDLYAHFCKAHGRRPRTIAVPVAGLRVADRVLELVLRRRPLEALYTDLVLSPDRFTSQFGWDPVADLEQTVVDLVESARSTRDT